jgi:putative flavoprotein involved in K+ transport
VGFELNFAEDGSGIIGLLNRRASGYYYDIGASQLIADRHVALRKGSFKRINERSIVLTDGTELPADVIVYATGYGPLSEVVARVTSPEIAAKVGPLWGYGSGLDGDKGPWEGELRGVWKPTRQEGLWVHTGGLVQTRFASLMVALQLKARFEGLPTPVYGLSMAVEN